MASRNFSFDALVLRRFPIGEAHRGVVFLTREEGLLTAIAHGAAKSQTRLKLLTTPIRRVGLKAYHDPVAATWKVVDLEERRLYGGLSQSLERSATASLWAELLIKTSAGGQALDVYDLFAEAFDQLDRTPPETVARLQLQVLWRFLAIAGLMPDLSRCAVCERPLAGQAFSFDPETGDPWCADCSPARRLRLEALAADYLLATEIFDLAESLTAPLAEKWCTLLVEAALAAWERSLGAALKTTRVFPGGAP